MREKRRRTKNVKWIILSFLIIMFASNSLVWAYYFKGEASSVTTTFKFVADENDIKGAYLRADVFTYWINAETGKIVGKNSWELNEICINNNWSKIGNYYYFNTTVSKEIMNLDEIPLDYQLISSSTPANELSSESLSDATYIAVYKIIYEILEDKDGLNSSNDAWNVVYTDNKLVTNN